MGLSRNSCTSSVDASFFSKSHALCTTASDHDGFCEFDDSEVKFKSLLYKMIWDFGLGCVIPRRQRRSSGENEEKDGDCGGCSLEHNKAWLLAESGGCGVEEPHSVHSSFRFSFCSQVELESMTVNNSSSATVLMVNLDNGLLTDSKSRELKWRRIESLERSISPVAHSLIRFSYSEILSATGNFSNGRVLGRGALSCVFKGRVGILRTAVAIKRLDKDDKESSKAFCRELMIASSLHNRYVVPLVGFCIDADGGLFLVYKYVSGGSLEQYLHEKKRGMTGSTGLPWSARYKVAMGIAEAIEYLHSGTERCVVHRDIKPSNILLSSKKTPKLCDFGLATWTPAPSVPFLCKTVKGTFGYLAPEYFQHGKVSDKTDIYAFGVVLLELITGRKPIESKRGPGEENLVLWAKPLLEQGGVEKLLDPQLTFTQKNSEQIARMVRAATACINNEESRRPGMGEIVRILQGKELIGLNRKKAVLSGNGNVHDSYPQSLKRTKSEMKSHFALAMLGVEFEDDDHLYCR
ncbi:probable serine/threonine-protein kinase PBL7 [Sesamum indicum]|uniref:Probable serine/threonine-protein kinase PBL7 n=1 Tax=Sesamum indicum TaxID=4182 RepID=A0A6I9UML6_SESIN|nr:probable serine/threonine-protein kinase PBL7 [Sesamum indicum]